MYEILPFNEIKKIFFKQRPISISAELRPLYKIGQLLLILKINCIGKKASLIKLHLFNWMLHLTNNEFEIFLSNLLSSPNKSKDIFFRINPSVNFALDYCFASGLIVIKSNGKFKLTESGNDYIDKLLGENLFSDEFNRLNGIGKKISDNLLNQIIYKNKEF